MPETLKKVAVPAAVVLGGAVVAALLASAREAPPRETHETPGPLVESVVVAKGDYRVVVRGNGTVEPTNIVQVVSQVAGKVAAVHPNLVNGGVIGAGEVLLEIDPADYELAVQRAEADVSRADVQLQIAEAEAQIAVQEWRRLHPDEAPPALVAREPQLVQARADLTAARAAVAAARLDLERTRVSLPTTVRVASESVDVGQFTIVGQPVATAYDIASVEIPVPLEDSDLAWFDVPGPGQETARGSAAVVTATFAGRAHTWGGRVVRSEAEVDRQTRVVRVVVRVDGPFTFDVARVVLVPGMFVDVAIQGRTLDDVVVLPRRALHPDDLVWLAADGRLSLRPVELARRERDRVVIAAGLQHGEVVITSQLDVVSEGMKVRLSAEAGR